MDLTHALDFPKSWSVALLVSGESVSCRVVWRHVLLPVFQASASCALYHPNSVFSLLSRELLCFCPTSVTVFCVGFGLYCAFQHFQLAQELQVPFPQPGHHPAF